MQVRHGKMDESRATEVCSKTCRSKIGGTTTTGDRGDLATTMWTSVVSAFTRPLIKHMEGEAPLEWCPVSVPWPIIWHYDASHLHGVPSLLPPRAVVVSFLRLHSLARHCGG